VATSGLAAPDGPGFDVGSVVGDDVVACVVDDDEITVTAPDPDPAEESAPLATAAAPPARASAFAPLQGLIERVPSAPSGLPSPPLSGSSFRTTDTLGRSADALDVTANPVQPAPSYLGVYHVNLGGGRFALCLAASRDLKTWRKLADLDAAGAAMGTLVVLPDGGFLVAYEAQRATTRDGKVATNVRLRHYRDPAALLSGRATAQRTLPRRLSPSNEGTPNFRSITWRGSLAASEIKLGFHYLDFGPPSKPHKVAVDREARGTLEDNRWSVVVEAGIDRALSRMGFHGNHGGRRQFRFRGKTWRIYEVQQFVNITGSWRAVLYDPAARTLKILRVTTPGRSRSFANPIVKVLPSPHPSGGDALVVSMFIFGVGAASGESGELVYYKDL
jgi:hypothetical protein